MHERAPAGGWLLRAGMPLGVVVCAAVTIVAGVAEAGAQARLRPKRDYRLEFHGLEDAACPSEAAYRADVARLCGVPEDVFDPNGRHVIRVVVRKGRLYESSIALYLPDGTADPDKHKAYAMATCAQAMREAAVAAAAMIPLEVVSTAPAATACDEACIEKRVEEAREAGRREGYEKGRADGRKERESEIREDIRDEVARQMRAMVLPTWPQPKDPPVMTLPFAVHVDAALSIGYGLDVGAGVVIGAEWRPIENFSVGLDLRGIAPHKVEEFGMFEPKLQLKATMLSVLVAPCFRWKILMGCAVLDAGGVYLDTVPHTWFERVAAGPRVGVDVPFAERFSVRVTGDLLFPIIRNHFEKVEGGWEFEDPLVSGFVTAGLAVSF
jgi:hypothetical protein